jgi:hypothetical protein
MVLNSNSKSHVLCLKLTFYLENWPEKGFSGWLEEEMGGESRKKS